MYDELHDKMQLVHKSLERLGLLQCFHIFVTTLERACWHKKQGTLAEPLPFLLNDVSTTVLKLESQGVPVFLYNKEFHPTFKQQLYK